MALQLERPLCVFDLETTGLQITKDRIVQIAVIKLFEDGHTETFNELVNPGQTISAEIADLFLADFQHSSKKVSRCFSCDIFG